MTSHIILKLLTHVIYNVVSHPEYTEMLREEAQSIIVQYGWTKNALSQMHKIDSFVKETHRLNSTSARKSMNIVVV